MFIPPFDLNLTNAVAQTLQNASHMPRITNNTDTNYALMYGLDPYSVDASIPTGDVTLEDLYANNPYLDQTVESTFWDQVGLSNKRDNRLAQLQQAGAEYNAEIAKMQYENEYNSPEAQAQRMREAGLNPDLMGTEAGGTSAGTGQVASPAVEPGSAATEGLSNIFSFAQGVLSAVTMGCTVAKDFQALKLGGLDLDAKEIDVAGKARDFALGVVGDWQVTPETFAGGEFDSMETAKGYVNRPGAQKYFANALQDLVNSMRVHNESYDVIGEHGSKRARAAGSMGSKYYNDPMEVLGVTLGPIYDMEVDLWDEETKTRKKSFQFGRLKHDHDIHVLNATNWDLEASRFDAENQWGFDQANFSAQLNTTRNKVVKDLQKKADDGNISAMVTLMFMSSIGPAAKGLSAIGSAAGSLGLTK